MSTVEGAMGEAVGKLYVGQHFPAERKARMEVLVKNLLEAYKQSIDTLDWMSPETKKEAQAKLAKFTPKIGYPNKWRDYSTLTIDRDDLVGNVMRARDLRLQPQRQQAGQADRPRRVGHDAADGERLLQPDDERDRVPGRRSCSRRSSTCAPTTRSTTARIGAVIGHEISHGFDDKGSQSDGDGNLRDWWTAEDRAKFQAKADALVKQYNALQPAAGLQRQRRADPGREHRRQLGRGDRVQGLQAVAGRQAGAGDRRPDRRPALLHGLRPGMAHQDARSGADRPGQDRPALAGPVPRQRHHANQPGFYEAFGVKEGDKMYLAPKDRVIIW